MRTADLELEGVQAEALKPPHFGEHDPLLDKTWGPRPGLIGWIMTGNHKRLGILQISTRELLLLPHALHRMAAE